MIAFWHHPEAVIRKLIPPGIPRQYFLGQQDLLMYGWRRRLFSSCDRCQSFRQFARDGAIQVCQNNNGNPLFGVIGHVCFITDVVAVMLNHQVTVHAIDMQAAGIITLEWRGHRPQRCSRQEFAAEVEPSPGKTGLPGVIATAEWLILGKRLMNSATAV